MAVFIIGLIRLITSVSSQPDTHRHSGNTGIACNCSGQDGNSRPHPYGHRRHTLPSHHHKPGMRTGCKDRPSVSPLSIKPLEQCLDMLCMGHRHNRQDSMVPHSGNSVLPLHCKEQFPPAAHTCFQALKLLLPGCRISRISLTGKQFLRNINQHRSLQFTFRYTSCITLILFHYPPTTHVIKNTIIHTSSMIRGIMPYTYPLVSSTW